jgi:hypothetical protein
MPSRPNGLLIPGDQFTPVIIVRLGPFPGLKADNERLNGDLVAERQRADRAIAGLTALARERSAARQADREQLAAARAAA